ncbi:MAG: type II toxin-antitoxin system RelE/ParE family toxin [Candidatus Thermoplasmatota archaeon]|nr:type II toxin-antitoxin system RelE/ParE family toxin [Candidatus Thermoplasmatota archaeon]
MNRKSSHFKILQSKDFLKDVKKVLKSGDKSVLSKIQKTIDGLKIDPYNKRPNMDIKLISKKNESIYRVRLGKYRLVYEIDKQSRTVFITMFFSRGKGYQKNR